MKIKPNSLIPLERIEQRIFLIRGERVMFDSDLAELYGVTTKRLNEQIKRNHKRFPADFVFRLTKSEIEEMNWSQIATGSQKHRDPRSKPYVFTEHGALAASFVLNTPVAIEMSVLVVRTFVKLRRLLASHAGLARRLDELEKKYDKRFRIVFEAIKKLMEPPIEPKKKPALGFQSSAGK